jgi:alanyl-tRNA synthetase
MKKLTGEEIIRTYLDFFVKNGHQEVESSSLIPHDDPTVLWVNAGVTPLKKYFDGTEVPSNRRLTSCQKCIRTGDIEEVGKTARHHTFFQMLGNFSIGDYFKEEALTWAFELLTGENYFNIDKNKLYMTVYPDDIDAYNIWVKLGVDPSHIIKLKGNFWEIGEGPSGPDSEIFFDRGVKYDKDNIGIKLLQEEIENDRYIEIWNNVFSQFNAKNGVPRNEYQELPSKNIDTGMGVERMACILQETETNYETDLFMPIMDKISELSLIPYEGQMEFKVIADHVRTLTFAISDGATFENYGRGYVIRRLLRRAVRMGRKLGINQEFMASLVDVVVDKYSNTYPYLTSTKDLVKEQLSKEERLFQKTLLAGEKRLEEIFNTSKVKEISGSDAFKLYDTYGYPFELTLECAEEKGFTVNKEDFDKYMQAQKEMARSRRKNESSMNLQNETLMNYKEESTFVGYEKLGVKTTIIGLIKDNNFVSELTDEGYVVLKENPFYAESGGQVADNGYLKNDSFKAEVVDVSKAPNKQHLLYVKVLSGTIRKDDEVLTNVNRERRESIMKNHSATHLIQKTLQEVLGNNVHQAGSYVDDLGFRFDFNYHGRLSDEIICKIEDLANERVNKKVDAKIEYLSLEEAKNKGAMALFEDKYGSIVRVVTLGDSIELCGGTHVNNTKDIGRIAISAVTNKGADTFRLEGSTDNHIEFKINEGMNAYQNETMKLLEKAKKILKEAQDLDITLNFPYKTAPDNFTSYRDVVLRKNKVEELKKDLKDLEKEYNNKKQEKTINNLEAFMNIKEEINGLEVIISICNDYDVNTLKLVVDTLCNRLNNGLVLLANVNNNSVNFICKTNATNSKINCGNIIRKLASLCEGNGGGSSTFGQGGGRCATDIAKHLLSIKEDIKNL